MLSTSAGIGCEKREVLAAKKDSKNRMLIFFIQNDFFDGYLNQCYLQKKSQKRISF
jgi:hypothetical protein